jgi:hypothetical protein
LNRFFFADKDLHWSHQSKCFVKEALLDKKSKKSDSDDEADDDSDGSYLDAEESESEKNTKIAPSKLLSF